MSDLELLAHAIADALEKSAPLKIEGGSEARRQWLADILAVQTGFSAVTGGMTAFAEAMETS